MRYNQNVFIFFSNYDNYILKSANFQEHFVIEICFYVKQVLMKFKTHRKYKISLS